MPQSRQQKWKILILRISFPKPNCKQNNNDYLLTNDFREVLDCPTAEVCVYGDRAEIGRLVTVKELEPGTQEILIKGLPLSGNAHKISLLISLVEESSIRISGGSGAATLLEVKFLFDHSSTMQGFEQRFHPENTNTTSIWNSWREERCNQ